MGWVCELSQVIPASSQPGSQPARVAGGQTAAAAAFTLCSAAAQAPRSELWEEGIGFASGEHLCLSLSFSSVHLLVFSAKFFCKDHAPKKYAYQDNYWFPLSQNYDRKISHCDSFFILRKTKLEKQG